MDHCLNSKCKKCIKQLSGIGWGLQCWVWLKFHFLEFSIINQLEQNPGDHCLFNKISSNTVSFFIHNKWNSFNFLFATIYYSNTKIKSEWKIAVDRKLNNFSRVHLTPLKSSVQFWKELWAKGKLKSPNTFLHPAKQHRVKQNSWPQF